jgi:hypothetical protein
VWQPLDVLALYAHNHDRERPHDLTDWVTSLDILLSTAEPWSSISASLRLPHADRLFAPDPDDWLTVQQIPSGRAIAWGQVDVAPEPGVVREGTKLTGGITRVVARSWLNALAKAQIYAWAAVGRRTSAGTLFTLEEWDQRFNEIMKLAGGQLGEQLTKLIRMFGRLDLPASLGGGQLGHSVAVAHNSATSERLGYGSPVDSVLGSPVGSGALGDQAFPESTTALALLLGAFWPNRELVEFFEVLTPLDSRLSSEVSDGVFRVAGGALLGAAGSVLAGNRSNLGLAALGSGARAAGGALTASALVSDARASAKLRAIPTLWYRLKPWREEAVDAYLKKWSGQTHAQAGVLAAELFPGRTWPSVPDFTLTEDEVVSFEPPTRPTRVNTVSIESTFAHDVVKFWEDAGLPMLDLKDISRHGVRAMFPRWPFIDPQGADPLTLTTVMSAVVAQMFLRQERFYQGAVKVPFRPELQPGRVMQLTLPGSGRKFTAYIESVRHSLTREGSVLTGWSHITYSRGLYEGQERVVRPDAPVERGTEPERRAKMPTVVVDQAFTRDAPAAFPDRPSDCTEGRGTTFPTESELDLTKIPAWLIDWAVARGFRRSDLTGPLRANVLVSAACAYVIEAYWSQPSSPFPGARIDVLASVRSGDTIPNHLSGHAFDFAIVTLPALQSGRTHAVLQTWASISKLAGARRLPRGGAGVYINFGPGGLSGTRPDQAGVASRPKGTPFGTPPDRRFPAGGSAGVHYDYRGTFGFAGDATTWIAADLNGDGSDEFTLTRDDRRVITEYLPQNHPDVLAYFNSRGANDPSMIDVGPTVPNVLQVLGQQASCFARITP